MRCGVYCVYQQPGTCFVGDPAQQLQVVNGAEEVGSKTRGNQPGTVPDFRDQVFIVQNSFRSQADFAKKLTDST